MEINVIPNIYEAFRTSSQDPVQTIFPTASSPLLNNMSQIAYYLKKQSKLGERLVERAREQRFEELAKQDILFGTTLKTQGKTVVKYKFVVPNQIGFPVIGISSDVRSINSSIAAALGVPNYTSRALNSMREIQANELPIIYTNQDKRTNIITRPDKSGYPVKIFITRFNYKI
jgi:hypothetical protein